MSFPHPLKRTFRYLEWIFIIVHFSMGFNDTKYNFPVAIEIYTFFFVLSWVYPINRPYWQRCCYIILGLVMTVWARYLGIDIELFLFFYIAKSYFLLNRRITLFITIFTGLIWSIRDLQRNKIPVIQLE